MPVVVPVIVNIGVIHANDPLTDVKAISHVLGAPSPKMMLSVPPYAASSSSAREAMWSRILSNGWRAS